MAKLEHRPQVAHGAVRALAIGLVDIEDVRDLEDARLDRLNVVAHARDHDHHHAMGQAGDVDLVLTHADRLDDHDLLAQGVHDPNTVGGSARQPAQVPPRGQGTDEDPLVLGVALHADAIAQDGPPREGARGDRPR